MEPVHIPHHKGGQGLGLAGHLTVTLLPAGDLAAYRAKTAPDALPNAVPVRRGTTTKLPARNKKARKWTLWTLWFNTYRCVVAHVSPTNRVSDCHSDLDSLENFLLLWSP
jgi:hypothetical protein